VAGQPATFDETFLTEIVNFLETLGKPTADSSGVPSIAEEEFLETYLPGASSCSSSLENIPSVVSADGGAQGETLHDAPNVEAEPMDVGVLDVDDSLIQPPQPQSYSNDLSTPVCPPFSINIPVSIPVIPVSIPVIPVSIPVIPVSIPVSINTNGDVSFVVQVGPIPPTRSQSVIKQGPALVTRLSTTQAPCRQARGKRVAKTNAERCELYRKRQKSKKVEGEEELTMLADKNRALKAKEAALRIKVQRMTEAVRRMGLGN
jgi:hypothetical protein